VQVSEHTLVCAKVGAWDRWEVDGRVVLEHEVILGAPELCGSTSHSCLHTVPTAVCGVHQTGHFNVPVPFLWAVSANRLARCLTYALLSGTVAFAVQRVCIHYHYLLTSSPIVLMIVNR
jgi:hypothetical protein